MDHETVTHHTFEPLALADAIANQQESVLDADVVTWLRAGFRRFQRGDASLEECLRLTKSSRKRARNKALRRAAEIIDDGRGLEPCELAKQLAQAIRRFESIYPPWKRDPDTARGMSPMNAAIHSAFASGDRMMRSSRRLLDLLR